MSGGHPAWNAQFRAHTGQAKEIAGCWKNAAVIEVEGDYALQMENPAGLARALSSFAEEVVKP